MDVEKVGYTADEAAQALGVSLKTIDALDAEGRLERIDFGDRRIRRYSIDCLRDFARSGQRYPATGELEARRRAKELRDAGSEADTTSGRTVVPRRAAGARKPRVPVATLPLRIVTGAGAGEAGEAPPGPRRGNTAG